MKLVLNTPEKIMQFKVLFQNIKAFSEHVVLRLSKNGMYMQGMDATQCSCFESNLKSDWFDTYDFDAESDVSLMGINTNIMNKVIGTFSDGQVITFGGTDEHLELSFTGGHNESLDKFFEIPLMDIDQDTIQLDDKESDVDLVMSSKRICELVSQMQLFDQKVSLKFTDENVVFLASGLEGSMTVNVSFDDVLEYTITEDTELCQSYSLAHISMMCLFGKLADEFSMKFSNNRPMEGKYKLNDDSYVTFYLAPKFDDDE